MRERIKEIGYWLEDKLKDLCGEITPDKRLTVVLIVLLLAAIINLYMTFSTINNWGNEDERKQELKIEHIKNLEFKQNEMIDSDLTVPDHNNVFDSINQQNTHDYEQSNKG